VMMSESGSGWKIQWVLLLPSSPFFSFSHEAGSLTTPSIKRRVECKYVAGRVKWLGRGFVLGVGGGPSQLCKPSFA
jgi:hypothetical protein